MQRQCLRRESCSAATDILLQEWFATLYPPVPYQRLSSICKTPRQKMQISSCAFRNERLQIQIFISLEKKDGLLFSALFRNIFFPVLSILGLGRAIALALAEAGAETFALSRTQADLDSLKQEVQYQLLHISSPFLVDFFWYKKQNNEVVAYLGQYIKKKILNT